MNNSQRHLAWQPNDRVAAEALGRWGAEAYLG